MSTLRNSAPKSSIFDAIAKVNRAGVKWKGLAHGEFGVNFRKYKFFLFWAELIFLGGIKSKEKYILVCLFAQNVNIFTMFVI